MNQESGQKKNYEWEVLIGNTAFFHFKKGAQPEDYKAAFEPYQELVEKPYIKNLGVIVDQYTWDDTIRQMWLKTAEMADQYNLEKWGVVTPGGFIWEKTIEFVIKKGNLAKGTSYKTQVLENKQALLDWIREN